MAVLFQIDGQTYRCVADVISIGRDPSNQISLPNDTRLAPVHAALRLVNGRWIVESKDGGPIRVGTGRPTQFAWLNPGDTIHLTEAGPAVMFTPETVIVPGPQKATAAPVPIVPEPRSLNPYSAAEQPVSVNPNTTPTPEPQSSASAFKDSNEKSSNPSAGTAIPNWVLFAGAGCMAAVVLIGLGLGLAGKGRPNSDPVPAVSTVSLSSPKPDSEPNSSKNSSTTGSTASDTPTAAADPSRALYCLELRTADRKRTVQIGTAWAVTPRRLVTTGDAARGIALNQEFFPNAFARHTFTGEEFEIKGMTLHPQYESAASRLEQAIRDMQRLKAEFERTTEAVDRQKIEELLHKLDSEAIVAADESVNVNMAILELVKDAPTALNWATAPVMKIGQQVTLVGHPLPRAEQLVDPDHPVPVQQSIGRIQHTESLQNPRVPSRCLVRFDEAIKNQNWSGSPVLNAEGIVIGLYVRITPPPPGTTTAPIATHDVAIIEGVGAILKNKGS